MYGKRRVVLKLNRVIAVAGGKSHFPIGFWYEQDGKLYADLKSAEQKYQRVNTETIANKGIGGVQTKDELRDLVMDYYTNLGA